MMNAGTVIGGKSKRMAADSSANSSVFYDLESEAVWTNITIGNYTPGIITDANLDKILKAREILVRALAKIGVQINKDDLEIDLPDSAGTAVCSVVFFFKRGELPSESDLQTIAKQAPKDSL